MYHFLEQLLSHILTHFFGLIPYDEVTLIKTYNKPLLQKSETEVFKQKKFHKKLVQSQQAKKLGRFEIKLDNVRIANNKQIFAVKLLANLVAVSDCYIVLNMFEQFPHLTFPISLDVLTIIDYC